MAANIDRQPAWGMFPLRLVVGIVFIAHSWIKFHMMGIAGTTKFMGGLGIPMPNVAAVCIIALEAIGGVALILGVGTRLFAPLLAMDMLGAIFFAKRHAGLIGPNSWELEATLCAACVTLAIVGAGGVSIDALGRRRRAA